MKAYIFSKSISSTCHSEPQSGEESRFFYRKVFLNFRDSSLPEPALSAGEAVAHIVPALAPGASAGECKCVFRENDIKGDSYLIGCLRCPRPIRKLEHNKARSAARRLSVFFALRAW